MLQLFDTYASLFKSWQVICYEQEADGTLRRRWDNAPHWPDVATAPHHVHLPGQETPEPSNVTNLEDLLRFIQNWFRHSTQTESTSAPMDTEA